VGRANVRSAVQPGAPGSSGVPVAERAAGGDSNPVAHQI
ncbi:MAG: hypothetical protein AVDCRST_MAG89-3461, partial [uncultured Gemmatimonadetes bacterium]